MVEEFESIRCDLQGNMPNFCPMNRTIEHLTLLSSKFENDISIIAKRQELLETQINKASSKDVNKEVKAIKTQLLSNKNSYNSLCDQMGDIINNMNEEVSQLKFSQTSCNQNIESIKRNISDLNQSMRMSSIYSSSYNIQYRKSYSECIQ